MCFLLFVSTAQNRHGGHRCEYAKRIGQTVCGELFKGEGHAEQPEPGPSIAFRHQGANDSGIGHIVPQLFGEALFFIDHFQVMIVPGFPLTQQVPDNIQKHFLICVEGEFHEF